MSDVEDAGFAGMPNVVARLETNDALPPGTILFYTPRKRNALGEFIESEEAWGKRCGVITDVDFDRPVPMFVASAAADRVGLEPLESDRLCACEHPRTDHIALLWGHHEHDGACRAKRCFCEKFIPAAESA